jgi:CRP-like cAMP-binding protein
VLKKSLVGYMDKKDFLRLIKRTEVHTRIEKLLESRLIKVENRLEELAFCDVSTRLARLLLRLSRIFPKNCPEGAGKCISLRLTQQELGNLIAATREITSLTLNEFRRNEWVKLHGRHLCIHNQSAIKREGSAV